MTIEKVSQALKQRQDYKSRLPLWCVFRTDTEKLMRKVCWKELSNEMQATALEKDYNLERIGTKRLIPLHTAYLIPTETFDEAIVLTAIFNSVPFREFVMSFAPRARGGYFRHFSWTVGLTPVPSRLASTSQRRISPNGPSNPRDATQIIRAGKKLLGDLDRNERRRLEGRLDEELSESYCLSSAEFATLTNYYLFMRPPQKELDLLGEEDEEEEGL